MKRTTTGSWPNSMASRIAAPHFTVLLRMSSRAVNRWLPKANGVVKFCKQGRATVGSVTIRCSMCPMRASAQPSFRPRKRTPAAIAARRFGSS